MLQWEVGWADITLGVLGAGCALHQLRGSWMTATVVAWTVSFGGDAIGHVMQLTAHDNQEPANVWSLPSDILMPLLAIVLLVAYRRSAPSRVGQPTATAPARAARR